MINLGQTVMFFLVTCKPFRNHNNIKTKKALLGLLKCAYQVLWKKNIYLLKLWPFKILAFRVKQILFTRTFPETRNKNFPKNKTCLLHFLHLYIKFQRQLSILRWVMALFVNILSQSYSGSKHVFFNGWNNIQTI